MQEQTYATYQHTFFHDVSCKGIGIHSGKKVCLTLRPAPTNHGIVFKRVDIEGSPEIPATYDSIFSTPLCTRIGLTAKESISTIEHIMAALAAFEIDNALIEINGSELPIMDGSSNPFVALFQCAGKVAQDKERLYLRIKKPITLKSGEKEISITPSNHLSISFQALSKNADLLLNNQTYTYDHSWFSFKQEIASARTVAFYDEISYLQANGLGLGGSLDNTVVLKEGKVLNEAGLRYDNEFARHKILDALGDFYLAGFPILGHIKSVGGGHALNAEMLEKLMVKPEVFDIDTLGNFQEENKLTPWENSSCLIYTAKSSSHSEASTA